MTHGVGKLMRILSIKTYLNNPHSPEITLSNSSVSQSVANEIKKIPINQVTARTELDEVVRLTQRGFRQADETTEGVKTLLEKYKDYFTEAIAPIAVQTMQALIGNKDLQFELGNAYFDTVSGRRKVKQFNETTFNPTWNGTQLLCKSVQMRHLSYPESNDSTIQPTENALSAYPYWDIQLAYLTPADEGLQYLYVEAPRSALSNLGYLVNAHFRLYSKAQVESGAIHHTATNFYFEIGILNSNATGTRSFSPLYGYTEISGGRIGTDMIRSKNGNMTIDLITGVITGIFNFIDGLISSQIKIGDSNNTIAGINYDPYVFWAGKTNVLDREVRPYHPTAGFQWAQLPVFSVTHDGTMRVCKRDGTVILGAYAERNAEGQNNFVMVNNILHVGGESMFAKKVTLQTGAELFVTKGNILLDNGYLVRKVQMATPFGYKYLYAMPPVLMLSFTLKYSSGDYTYSIDYAVANITNTEKFGIERVARLGKGQVKIFFNHGFRKASNYFIIANGLTDGDHPVYVTIKEKTFDDITITMSDDSTLNDGNCEIQVMAIKGSEVE